MTFFLDNGKEGWRVAAIFPFNRLVEVKRWFVAVNEI